MQPCVMLSVPGIGTAVACAKVILSNVLVPVLVSVPVPVPVPGTPLGQQIMITLCSLQIESGSRRHLLEFPNERILYITKSWITDMRDFMAANEVSMEVTKAQIVPLCREGDRYLMDDIRILECFNNDDLYDLNAC